jgi:hypothetical protein
MTWTRERIAYDLISHKKYLIDNALCREAVQSGLYVTAIATTIIGIYTYMR